MSDTQTNMMSGRNLSRNVLWNLLGTGMPLLVAIVAIPILIEGLGIVRFGVLTIAWMVVGYFSLFDLGLGRALTKLIAEKLGKGMDNVIPSLIWTAMLLMMVLGVLGAVVVATLSRWLVEDVLEIPLNLQPETLTAFYLLAASVPIVIGSAGLRGILEAHQRFGLVNVVRITLGIFTFLGPVLVLPFSSSLVPVVGALVIARLISGCMYVVLCLNVDSGLRHSPSIDRVMARSLINFGGWMTVSNIVSPLMVYLDRFLIGAIVSMTAVAYYSTPYEIVTKLWVIPGALMGVMFPAFSAALANDRGRAARLYSRSVNYIFISLFPAVLIIITFAHGGLTLWLGSEFADNSTLVLQMLAVGVFLNSHANIPYGLVQSAGRPDLTAKLHLAELPVYLLILWWLLNDYGIVGAAIAWVLRMAVDTIVLFVMAGRLLPTASPFTLRFLLTTCIALFSLVLGAVITGLVMKWLFVSLLLLIFAILAWILILTSEDKGAIRKGLKILPVCN